MEGLIGFFINALALRSQVTGDKPFADLLQEVKITTLEAYSHQEVPFEKIVDAVVKTRDTSRNPLVQVAFTFQNTPEVPELKLGSLSLSAEGHERITTKYDIVFYIRETSAGIRGTIEYATDLYRAETIERMIGHYTNLLRSIVDSVNTPVGSLDMLSGIEEQILLVDFNNTSSEYPKKDKNIVALFEEQTAKHPEWVAIVFLISNN